jgi:hypothetical protein
MTAENVKRGLAIGWMRIPSAYKAWVAIAAIVASLVALGGRITVQGALPGRVEAYGDSLRAHSLRMDGIERQLRDDYRALHNDVRDIKAEQTRTNCYLEALSTGRPVPPRCLQ